MSTLLVLGTKTLLVNSAPLSVGAAASSSNTGASSLTLTDLVQGQVIQRSTATTGSVPILFAYTGTLGAPRGKLVSHATGGTVYDGPLTIVSAANGSAVASLPGAPIGDDYTLTIYDGATVSAGTHRFGIGVVGVWAGQSNLTTNLSGGYNSYTLPGSTSNEFGAYFAGAPAMPSFRILDSTGYHRPSNGTALPSYDTILPATTSGFNSLTDNVFAFGRVVGASLSALYGRTVPVAMAISQQDGTSISAWLSGGARAAELTAVGDHEFFMWRQGEADVAQGTSWYLTQLGTLHTAMLAQVATAGRASSAYKFFIGTLSQMTAPSTTQSIRTAQLTYGAQAAAAGHPGAQVGWSNTDLPSDGLHITALDPQHASMRRMIRTAQWAVGAASCSGRGATITGLISRSGQVCRLAVAHEAGSTATALQSLTGGTPSGFTCSADGFVSSIALPAAVSIVSATEIDVTLPPSMTGAASIHYQAGIPGAADLSGQSYDGSATVNTSNPVYDNITLPEPMASDSSAYALMGLPLLPTSSPISV